MIKQDPWPSVFLRDVCKFIGGSGFPEALQGNQDGDLPFIKVSDMELFENKQNITVANNWITRGTANRKSIKTMPASSVVFAKVGAALLLNRRRILTRDTCIDNNMMAAIPRCIDPLFLFYLLVDLDFSHLVLPGAVPSINQSQLSNIPINLPAHDEQSAIARILSTVDRAIEQTEALIAKQQSIKSGLMQDLLTRGIDEQGNLRSEKTHQFKDSPLGRIPVEWEIVTLSYFVKDLIAGVSVNSDDRPCGANEIGILKTSAISNGQFYANEHKTILSSEISRASTPILQNTILISRMNTPELVGESGFVDRNYPHLFLPDRIWMTSFVKGKEPVAKWLSYVISSDTTRQYISLHATGTSGSMKNLSKNSMLTMPIKAPMQVDEKIRISKILDDLQFELDRLNELANKLKLLKTALMQDLLTGRKRVTALLQEKEMVNA